MAHKVQQILKHVQAVALVLFLLVVQARIDRIRESIHALQQGIPLAAVLVEHGVQISRWFGIFDLLPELVDVDQSLDAIRQIPGALLGLLVRLLGSAGLYALFLDGILDLVHRRDLQVLQVCRQMLAQLVHIDLVGVVSLNEQGSLSARRERESGKNKKKGHDLRLNVIEVEGRTYQRLPR